MMQRLLSRKKITLFRKTLKLLSIRAEEGIERLNKIIEQKDKEILALIKKMEKNLLKDS